MRFEPEYDYSDKHFIQIKDKGLNNLQKQFDNAMAKARDKSKRLKSELDKLNEISLELLEYFNVQFLKEFEEQFDLGDLSVKEMLRGFSKFLFKSRKEWVNIYSKESLKAGNLFAGQNDFEATANAIIMDSWINSNKQFDGRASAENHCFLDLTQRNASYYFEKLAEYQAKREYRAYLISYVDKSNVKTFDDVKREGNQYTITRQTLAIKYLLEELGVQLGFINKSDVARLAHLLSAKEFKRIGDSTIYEKMKGVSLNDKKERADFMFVLKHFEALNTEQGSLIDNIVNKLKKDMEA